MNLQAIADGIATTIGTVTANAETATATADLPNSVGGLALLVYPPEVSALSLNMGRALDTYDFTVKLLRDPLDMPGRTRALYAWATALRPRVWTHFSLGISGVTEAEAVAMRVAIDGEEYASNDGTFGKFDVVDITVRVQVFEIAVGVAI